MNLVQTLIRNTIWRSAADVISRLTSAVFWVLVARRLGAQSLGSIAFALSLYSFFELLSSLGLGSVLTRDVAKNRDAAGQYFGHTLIIGSATALLLTAILALTGYLLQPNPQTQRLVWIMALALPLSGLLTFGRALLISAEKMVPVTIATVVENVFQLAAAWMALGRGFGVEMVVWIMVVGKLMATSIMAYSAATRVMRPVWKISGSLTSYLFKQVPLFVTVSILNSIFWSLAVILLTRLQGEVQAGYFSAAYKLVTFILILAMAYGQAMFPVSARLAHDPAQPDLHARLLRKSLKLMLIIFLAAAAGLSLLSTPIVRWLYGPEMTPAAPVLAWLAWLLVPYGLVPILAYTLVSHHRQRNDLQANFTGAAVLTLALVVLIPMRGAQGAAMAMVAGALAFFMVEFLAVHRWIVPLGVGLRLLWPFVGVGLMAGSVLFLQAWPLLLRIAAGAAVYLIFLWCTQAIGTREVEVLKTVISRQQLKDGIV